MKTSERSFRSKLPIFIQESLATFQLLFSESLYSPRKSRQFLDSENNQPTNEQSEKVLEETVSPRFPVGEMKNKGKRERPRNNIEILEPYHNGIQAEPVDLFRDLPSRIISGHESFISQALRFVEECTMLHGPTTRPPIEFRHRSSVMKTRKTLAACHLSPSLDSHPPLTFSLVNLGNLPSRRGSEDYSSPQLPGGDGFHRGEGGMGDG